MKKILFLITVILMSCPSAFAYFKPAPRDTLSYNMDPSLAQRGVLMKNWQTLDQYVELDSVKYQVVKDTVKNEVFAIVNQADPALKGVVNVPQFISTDGYGRLEVKGLGLYSFYLTKVSKVTLPESLEYIGDCSFYRCYSLTKLNIPEKVHTIGNLAFAYTAIDTLRIPDNVVDMGALCYDLFYSMDRQNQFRFVKYLYIGKGVKDIRQFVNHRGEIQDCWFSNVQLSFVGLEEIEASPDNEMVYSDNGALYYKKTHALIWYPRQKRDAVFVVPDGTPWHNPDDYDTFDDGTYIWNDWIQILKINEMQDTIKWADSYLPDLRKIILPYNMKLLYKAPSKNESDRSTSIYVQNPIPCEFKSIYSDYFNTGFDFDHYYPLYVPRGSLAAYKSDSDWGKFKVILEYDTIDYSVDYTSVIEPKADEAKVVVEGNNVSITTADNQSLAYIYDICGRLVASGRERTFSINQKGVFVLRMNSLTKKFIIR